MKHGAALLVAASATLYGIIPVLTKTLYDQGFSALSATWWRFFPMIIVLIIVSVVLHITVFLPLRRVLGIVIHCGIPSVLTMVLLNLSYDFIDVGTATTIHFLYPVVVSILVVRLYGERMRPVLVMSMMLIICGLLSFAARSSTILDLRGVGLAVCSSLTYAFYLVQLDRGGYASYNVVTVTLYTAVTGAVLAGAGSLIEGSWLATQEGIITLFAGTLENPMSVVPVVLLPLFSLAALCLLTLGSRHLDAQMTSIVGLCEPIVGLVMGVWALGEPLSEGKLFGSVLILGAILLVMVSDATPTTRAPQGQASVRLLHFLDRHNFLSDAPSDKKG